MNNRWHITTLIISTLAVTPLTAQERDDTELEEIIVIGTRSADRTVLDTPVPVDVVTSATLEATGAVAGELGQALAAVAPSFNYPRQSNSGSSDLVRAGQLRGLSPDQFLVLVNGKRRHTSSIVNTETKIGRGTAAVDFNTIPLNAISRIEVLRDGAGAQYGSDAIAGVVNVVLDRSLGFETNVSYGQHDTDVDPINQSITDGETFTVDAEYGIALAGDGFFKAGVAYRDRAGTNRAGFDTIPFFEQQTPDNLALAGQRNYTEGDPDVQELNIWWNSEFGNGALRWFTFGTAGSRESSGGAAFFRYPDSDANVRAVYDQGYRPQTRGDDTDLAATLGLRNTLGDWSLESSLTVGRNEFEFGVDTSLNASLGAASPTSFDSGTFELQQISLNVDGVRTLRVADRPASLAIGGEYRREDFSTGQGDPASFAAGTFDGPPGAQAAPGLTPEDEADVDRNVYSVYADLGVDLSTTWFVNGAVRFEDYSDFGSAATGKLSARWAPNQILALRGAVSNSFRAPNLAQTGFADTTLNFGANRVLVRTRTLPVSDPIARSLGASDLQEEQSFNLSAGFTAQWGDLALTFDAFRVDVDDRITLSERLFGAALEAFVQAQPGGANVESVRFFTNAVDTRTQGFDMVANWGTTVANGALNLSLTYHYSRTEIEALRATTGALTAVDPSLVLVGVEEINTLENAAPKHKTILTAGWDNTRFRALMRISRFDGATRVFNFGGGFEPEQTYGEETQVDFEVGYRFTESFSAVLGAVNVLDEYPDLSSADINFFGNLPYDILSPIGVNGRYLYTRAKYAF